jgi:hypothetical protein
MPEQPQPTANERFKADMPQIPGVGEPVAKSGRLQRSALWIVGGLVVVLVAVFVGGRLLSTSRHAAPPAGAVAQIDVPVVAPSAVPDLPMPVATENNPVVAQVGDLAKPWDSQQFTFRNRITGENVPALLLRLPGGSAAQAGGYWAFSAKAAYSNCQLQYVQDLEKLRNDYGYRGAGHPMIGNPCSGTVYDPLKYASIPGGVLARGAIVQGSDVRPPLGIEVRIKGREIVAVRME